MFDAVEWGFQAALMAPTQILAEQHYEVLCRWLEPLRVRLALRTAARKEETGPLPLFARPREGVAPQIIIGTHALLYEGVLLENLGFAVIDEQHKFGVSQRARLTVREPAPDVLVMTATPIPRTLTMTVYGDLDVSIIDEMPSNRGKIVTAVRDQRDSAKWLPSSGGNSRRGGRLHCLSVDRGEREARCEGRRSGIRYLAGSITTLIMRFVARPGSRLDKQAIMDRFRRGEINALISTAVIEVGVDVPNATVMLIENAERFGLAQLHQLRGRIGRGQHKSFCILLTEDKSPETMARLAVLERTSDFAVAEADWDLRGPGDLLGTAQSGLPALKLGNLKTDGEIMRRARTLATSILEADPKLAAEENQRFRRLIVEERGRLLGR